jgi:hypothetical protein
MPRSHFPQLTTASLFLLCPPLVTKSGRLRLQESTKSAHVVLHRIQLEPTNGAFDTLLEYHGRH